MKMLFIEGRAKERVSVPVKHFEKLISPIALFTTIQLIESTEGIKKDLEKNNKKVILLKSKHTKYNGQVLGCNVERIKEKIGSILYIGEGMFHPIALKIKNEVPVFSYNPYSKELKEISQKEIKGFLVKTQVLKEKFSNAKSVGIIVSLKYGQNYYKKVSEIKKKYPDKEFYTIVFDDIDYSQLINFNFIDFFINTSCPRIAIDDYERIPKPMINFEELLE